MKVNGQLMLGFLIVLGTILVASLVDGASTDLDEDKRILTDVYGESKMDPREGRIWAPWSHASGATRGRWNVGYGGSRYAPNVAWDSTMSRRGRGRRTGAGGRHHRHGSSHYNRHYY